MPPRSEHDLSDTEASPEVGGRRGSRFGRGILQSRTRPSQGLSNIASTLHHWTNTATSSLKTYDWTGNGRLLLPTLGRALQLTAILTVLIAVLIRLRYVNKPRGDRPDLVTFPFRYNISADNDTVPWNSSFGPYNVLLETHGHTTYSDGSMSPAQVVEWAIAYGYTALVVSDHNTIEGGLEAKRYAESKGYDKNGTIVVIPGVEYTCCRVHMNLIGINETISPSKAWPTDDELRGAIERTHELGGVAVLNHWAWSHVTEGGYDQWRIPGHPSRSTLMEWGIDAFESVNGPIIDLATLQYSQSHNLPIYAGSDVHGPTHEPHAWTTLLLPEEDRFNQEKILKEFKRPGGTSFLFNGEGPIERSWVPRNPGWDKWAPLTAINFGYLYDEQRGMYSFTGEFCHERHFAVRKWRAVWFVIWVVLAFFMYEVARAIFLWAYAYIEKRREGRIRLPLSEEDSMGLH